MRKLAYFIPAIVFTIMYGLAIVIGGIGSINPIVIVWVALLWIAGVLLNKGVVWGGLLGMIPGACFVYMGTQETGQIIKETPFGIIILFYYVLCIYFVYKKKEFQLTPYY